MRVFVPACVCSVLVNQHMRPLMVTDMICQHMTFAPKKTLSCLTQLLFIMAGPPSPRPFPPPITDSLHLCSFSLFLHLISNTLRLIWSVLGGRGTEGLSLFNLGRPALLPPALGPRGGLWRHLGPLGGIIKPEWPSPLHQKG